MTLVNGLHGSEGPTVSYLCHLQIVALHHEPHDCYVSVAWLIIMMFTTFTTVSGKTRIKYRRSNPQLHV